MRPQRPKHFPPPTERVIKEVQSHLEKLYPLDMAASLAGVPKDMLMSWWKDGKAGLKDYLPFTEMVDKELAKLSKLVMDRVYAEIAGGSFQAVQFLYKTRLQFWEKRHMEKLAEIEDRIEAEQAAGTGTSMTEEELQAAERRAEAELQH